MDWLIKSKEDKFKDLLIDFWNLLARVSYREITLQSFVHEIMEQKRSLIYLAREFKDPCSCYFKRYSYTTLVFN